MVLSDPITTTPGDRYDEELIAHVHPENWSNPEPDGRYNLVVIGGGTAGLVSAAGAATLGARVALIERNLMGGDCLNYGCVPSKGLIRSARAAADISRAAEFGVHVGGDATVDFTAVMERMRRLRSEIAPHDSVERLARLGVDVFLGHGRFHDKRSVVVADALLRFSKAVIATGTHAIIPAVPGLEEAGCLTNESLFGLTELPGRMAILGAGPVGCEMAQTFARFGSEVYLLEIEDRILPREPANISSIVSESLSADGVVIATNAKATRVDTNGSGKSIEIEVDTDGESAIDEISVDEVVASVGRSPNVDNLGLESAGVGYDLDEGIHTNGYLQTSNRRIYAAGDISSKWKFTHTADAQAAMVIHNSLFLRTKNCDSLVVPWCTYTDPEVAHVGRYPEKAAGKRKGADTYAASLEDNDRAILDGETNGLIEIYTQKGTDTIVGATMVGRNAGEIISELTLAIKSGTSLTQLASVIHPYPARAGIVRDAAREFMRSRLTPRLKRILNRWMAWRR